MSHISEVSKYQSAFMDPSTLSDMANNKNISEETKRHVVSLEFEKIFLEQMATDGLKEQFKVKTKDKAMSISETFIPKLLAYSLSAESPLGLARHFSENLKKM